MSPVLFSILVIPCQLLEEEDCLHGEDCDLREVRVPCGWVQGLSLPGHLAPQQASAAALEQE